MNTWPRCTRHMPPFDCFHDTFANMLSHVACFSSSWLKGRRTNHDYILYIYIHICFCNDSCVPLIHIHIYQNLNVCIYMYYYTFALQQDAIPPTCHPCQAHALLEHALCQQMLKGFLFIYLARACRKV